MRRFFKWFKKLFKKSSVKKFKTEDDFKEVERKLQCGENLSISELACLLNHLAEKNKKN